MFRPLRLNYEHIRQHAEQFLDKYHVSREIPIPIEAIVEFDLDMTIVPLAGLRSEIGVDAFLTSDLNSIYLDEWVMQFATTRARFSLAHEVAHWWLHDALYEAAAVTTVAAWKALIGGIDEADYGWFEWQANAFAGLVLVPTAPLRTAFERERRKAAELGLSPAKLEAFPARAALIRHLAKEFDVSEPVMEIRLEKDNHLPPLRGEANW